MKILSSSVVNEIFYSQEKKCWESLFECYFHSDKTNKDHVRLHIWFNKGQIKNINIISASHYNYNEEDLKKIKSVQRFIITAKKLTQEIEHLNHLEDLQIFISDFDEHRIHFTLNGFLTSFVCYLNHDKPKRLRADMSFYSTDNPYRIIPRLFIRDITPLLENRIFHLLSEEIQKKMRLYWLFKH